MPEEEVEQRDGQPSGEIPAEETVKSRRSFFTKRNVLIVLGASLVTVLLLILLSVFLYRGGVGDTYIKAQFVSKMADIGIDFDADVFRVTVSPLSLELKNATFNDRISGEKLFFVRDAQLGLTVQNLYSWQLSRDISLDTTDITGAEVWVKFDSEGRSNFSNLKLVEDQAGSRVNFKYESIVFSLRDSVVHFGDISRKIAADANNVVFLLQPENAEVPIEQMRYRFDLTSTESKFVYDERPFDPIDLRAVGIADRMGADITEFRLTTPIGTSSLNGRLSDWASLKYDLNIESTVDLTQASSIFPLGTSIAGIGNFKGKVSGSGEAYHVEGAIDSQSLTAEGVYLEGRKRGRDGRGQQFQLRSERECRCRVIDVRGFSDRISKTCGKRARHRNRLSMGWRTAGCCGQDEGSDVGRPVSCRTPWQSTRTGSSPPRRSTAGPRNSLSPRMNFRRFPAGTLSFRCPAIL